MLAARVPLQRPPLVEGKGLGSLKSRHHTSIHITRFTQMKKLSQSKGSIASVENISSAFLPELSKKVTQIQKRLLHFNVLINAAAAIVPHGVQGLEVSVEFNTPNPHSKRLDEGHYMSLGGAT